MHTQRVNDTLFLYNSDLSGVVVIQRGDDEIEVPSEDLLSFVAEHVRSERMSALEQASFRELLGLPAEQ